MVFWKTYPIQNIIKKTFNNTAFTDLSFERPDTSSPTGYKYEVLNEQNEKVLIEIQQFIKTHFGSPPNTPVLDIPVDNLLSNKDIILYVRNNNSQIVGCIRYHYLGKFVSDNNQEIYCEDCFCIHPTWRKKGVGDYLLTQLHIYVNKNNIPYSMFLKEGAQLSIMNPPFYSDVYVYKKLEPNSTSNIINVSIDKAYKLMDTYLAFNKMFVIRNSNSQNQIWKLYRKDYYNILVCFQDTYQRFEENNKQQKIGWITALFESPNIPDLIRTNALNQLADSMHKEFDYIWSNKDCISKWKVDGPFHWYLYQWTTNISIKKNYCILN
jgi:hypothetical protein